MHFHSGSFHYTEAAPSTPRRRVLLNHTIFLYPPLQALTMSNWFCFCICSLPQMIHAQSILRNILPSCFSSQSVHGAGFWTAFGLASSTTLMKWQLACHLCAFGKRAAEYMCNGWSVIRAAGRNACQNAKCGLQKSTRDNNGLVLNLARWWGESSAVTELQLFSSPTRSLKIMSVFHQLLSAMRSVVT